MSEIRRDEIVYEEGWRDTLPDEPVNEPPEEHPEEKQTGERKKEAASRPLLTVLQLILCMSAALVLFILKALDSGAYHDFMSAYHDEMSKPVISQKVFDAVDWNAIFGGGHVTVTATPDELSPR